MRPGSSPYRYLWAQRAFYRRECFLPIDAIYLAKFILNQPVGRKGVCTKVETGNVSTSGHSNYSNEQISAKKEEKFHLARLHRCASFLVARVRASSGHPRPQKRDVNGENFRLGVARVSPHAIPEIFHYFIFYTSNSPGHRKCNVSSSEHQEEIIEIMAFLLNISSRFNRIPSITSVTLQLWISSEMQLSNTSPVSRTRITPDRCNCISVWVVHYGRHNLRRRIESMILLVLLT